MAANVVRPGISENGDTEESRGRVKEIKKEWSVIEDGALAIRLQEEENDTHYSGNISRRRTVRSDIRTAKSAADEEAIRVFQEEHDIAEKNRQIEMEDEETAKKLQHEMMEEEKRKLREKRQQESEEADRKAANELYHRMMEEEKTKMRSQKSFEETDAELALRLQAHEEKKKRILSQKQRSLDYEQESERLAHHLAREEKYNLAQSPRYNHEDDGMHRHRSRHEMPSESRDVPGPKEPPRRRRELTDPGGDPRRVPGTREPRDGARPTSQRGLRDDREVLATPEGRYAKHGPTGPREPGDGRRSSEHRKHREVHDQRTDYLMPNVGGLRVAVAPEPTQDPPPRKHIPQRLPRQQSAPPDQHVYSDLAEDDSDEETDIIAKIQDDEELARRLQREEIQRSRAPSQLTDKQRHQLMSDQKIAIKMQHEEVMFSKKSTYDNYMGKVRDEIADPEPMEHVNRKNKTAVHTDAKYAAGIQLTDYTAAEGAQPRRTSASGHPGAGGNIITSIDPTYNSKDSGNVVLIKKKSISEEPLPVDDGAHNAVQGSKRRDSKDKGKRGSIFSKLKKK